MTGAGVMKISVYEGFQNSRNWKYLHLSFANIWRLGQVKDIKFTMNVSNKNLPNAEKYQGYSFHHFWVIKGKLTGRVKFTTHPPNQSGLKIYSIQLSQSNFEEKPYGKQGHLLAWFY